MLRFYICFQELGRKAPFRTHFRCCVILNSGHFSYSLGLYLMGYINVTEKQNKWCPVLWCRRYFRFQQISLFMTIGYMLKLSQQRSFLKQQTLRSTPYYADTSYTTPLSLERSISIYCIILLISILYFVSTLRKIAKYPHYYIVSGCLHKFA